MQFIDADQPRTVKDTGDDDVRSHVTISKVSIKSKYPGTASHMSRKSVADIDHNLNTERESKLNKLIAEKISEQNEGKILA